MLVSETSNNPVPSAEPVQKQEPAIYGLPQPTQILSVSQDHSLPVLKGIKIDPENPFKLEFILDTEDEEQINEDEVKRLVEYFLAALTLPEEDLWVNLSPYEKDRVIPDNLALTELGKGLLAEDYVLKQLVSSLTYPESRSGKKYWDKVYEEIGKAAGTTKIPVNIFNKVWIVSEIAEVYATDNIALIADARLKVMHEEDYLALKNNIHELDKEGKSIGKDTIEEASKVSSVVMKKMLLPEIGQQVNQGKHFANLRQIYRSFILAVWFKQKLKDSIFKYYIDQSKIQGIDLEDEQAKEKIYDLYVQAYQKGAYDYIKKDYDLSSRQYIRRRYCSGGINFNDGGKFGDLTLKIKNFLGENFEIVNWKKDRTVEVVLAPAGHIDFDEFGKEWGWDSATTDPQSHDSQEFQYIVHAIQDPALRMMRDMMALEHAANGGTIDPGRSIDLFSQPGRISEKAVISTSYIDQAHTGTWGDVGFILEVPEENIISTDGQDIGSPFYEGKEWARDQLKCRQLMSPSQLLALSSSNNYNEVVITGTHPDDRESKVKISGVFIKETPAGMPLASQDLVTKISGAAYQLNVPVIRIKAIIKGYEDSKPEVLKLLFEDKPRGIAYNKKGNRYVVTRDEEDLSFEAWFYRDEGRFSRPMKDSEFDNFVEVIAQTVNNEPDSEELKFAYQDIIGNHLELRKQQIEQQNRAYQARKNGEIYYEDTFPSVSYDGSVEWQNDEKRYEVRAEEGHIEWQLKESGNKRDMLKDEKEKLINAINEYVALLPETNKTRQGLEDALVWLNVELAKDKGDGGELESDPGPKEIKTSVSWESLKDENLIEEIRVELFEDVSSEHADRLKDYVYPIFVQRREDGSVVAGDSTQLSGAVIYNPDGSVIFLKDEMGRNLAEETVKQITLDESGNIYVATAASRQIGEHQFMGRIRKYDPDGILLGAYDVGYGEHRPRSGINIQGMEVFENKLYYTIADFGELRVLDLETREEKVFTWKETLGPLTMTGSMQLAIDRKRAVISIINSGMAAIDVVKLPMMPARIRNFDIRTEKMSETVNMPILGTGGFVSDGQNNVYIGDKDRKLIHVLNADDGYSGYINTPKGATSINIDKDGNLVIGRQGGVDVVNKEVIPQLLVKPWEGAETNKISYDLAVDKSLSLLDNLDIDPNVSAGTICQSGHEGSYEALDRQLERQYKELRVVYNELVPIQIKEAVGRYFNIDMRNTIPDSGEESGLRETEADLANVFSGYLSQAEFIMLQTLRDKIRSSPEYRMAMTQKGRNIEIFFVRPETGTELFWYHNDYAAGHFNQQGTRIHISLPIAIRNAHEMVLAQGSNIPRASSFISLKVAAHELNHIANGVHDTSLDSDLEEIARRDRGRIGTENPDLIKLNLPEGGHIEIAEIKEQDSSIEDLRALEASIRDGKWHSLAVSVDQLPQDLIDIFNSVKIDFDKGSISFYDLLKMSVDEIIFAPHVMLYSSHGEKIIYSVGEMGLNVFQLRDNILRPGKRIFVVGTMIPSDAIKTGEELHQRDLLEISHYIIRGVGKRIVQQLVAEGRLDDSYLTDNSQYNRSGWTLERLFLVGLADLILQDRPEHTGIVDKIVEGRRIEDIVELNLKGQFLHEAEENIRALNNSLGISADSYEISPDILSAIIDKDGKSSDGGDLGGIDLDSSLLDLKQSQDSLHFDLSFDIIRKFQISNGFKVKAVKIRDGVDKDSWIGKN